MPLAFASHEGQERGGLVSDARTGKRFPLELPIRIQRSDSDGEHKGVTGNLSAAGVYIKADEAFDVGSPVDFEITLPAEATGGTEDVVVHCHGRVVRTEDASGEGRGVACVIDSYEFVRNA
jgi:hypothetical protein